jgi:phage-related protein
MLRHSIVSLGCASSKLQPLRIGRIAWPAERQLASTLYGTFVVMAAQPRKTPLRFYRSANDEEPVREWLKSLPAADRKVIGLDLMRVQFRWPVGMPLCRPLGGGLWEVRSNVSNGRIARVLFCFASDVLVALHGFIKKTQKTPAAALAIAKKRMKEVQR